ncbi:hypothetical protein [Pseudomonas poae]|uniref:Uncharacterized protein n=1 Tax=Pseudomonas poae TaxID=200451 RepID=A0A2S9EC12_9PSED|nr:hypothetical protein [Pseudomonas poae]PRA23237.1 hypothetical protein CQZ97_25765 [Pseudomonas poae]PRC12490.1 hypothetical protein CQZ99_22835 [Pseudomonas poae]
MSLISHVEQLCQRLAPRGWRDLLLRHGLDITAVPLEDELAKPLPIDRSLQGFEDFSIDGAQGIKASRPAESLLFHALASPNVLTGPNGIPLTSFPTAAEIEHVLNYVYGVTPPSLAALEQQAGGAPLAIVTFAYEYRPQPETVHKRQADLCFSRTGVARVGTAPALYDPQRRGFLPFVEGQPQRMRVIPARYGAFIAMRQTGNEAQFGPMGFQPGVDPTLEFWVPLHKLFTGTECMAGLDLRVYLDNHQINEKIRQIHLRFRHTGWQEPDILNPPFVITQALCHWGDCAQFGAGLLTPDAKPALVELARYKGEPLSFMMPPNSGGLIHGRHRVRDDGSIEDLNDRQDVDEIVNAGGYRALHYQDAMADGWVRAHCPALELESVAAYSIIGAPDFFPLCGQRELKEWSSTPGVVPCPAPPCPDIWHTRVNPLSDVRFYINQSLEGGHFSVDDRGATAIVSLAQTTMTTGQTLPVARAQRQSWLPDFASGVFGPGWEIGRGLVDAPFTNMLCGYQLASPFTEDARICAALGSYWPGVAPDSTRTFEPRGISTTIIPLTDAEIGSHGSPGWDGRSAPILVEVQGRTQVQYQAYEYSDYTQAALAGQLSLAVTGQTSTEQYHQRVLGMWRAYRAVGAGSDKELRKLWPLLSFSLVQRPDAAFEAAQQEADVQLEGDVQHYWLYKRGSITTPTDNFKLRHVEMLQQVHLYVSADALLMRQDGGIWRRVDEPF